MRIIWFLLALNFTILSNTPQSSAQQSPEQTCDVPLVVTPFVPASRTVELVKDLNANDLTVRVGNSPGKIVSASVDSGPRRVALVLDASRNVPNDEWKLEVEMAASLVEHARPEDRFGFLVAGTDIAIGPVLSSAEVGDLLREAMLSRPPVADSSEKIYDALLEAAHSLDPPAFGDALFLFGHPQDSGSKVSPDQLQELILTNRLRFYAMSFTDPLRGKLPPGFDLNKPLPANLGQERLDKIANATGYFFSFHAVDVLRIPGQLELLKGFMGDLYAGIAEPYRLSLSTLATPGLTTLDVVVTDASNRGINNRDVHFPHYLYPCAQAALINRLQVKKFVAPPYPVAARKNRMQGTTVAEVLVRPDGTTSFVRMVMAHSVFRDYVEAALKQWTFEPAQTSGDLKVTVSFKLDGCDETRAESSIETHVEANLPNFVEVRTCLEPITTTNN